MRGLLSQLLPAAPASLVPLARPRRAHLVLAGLLMVVCLLPIWMVRYVPIYDYQNHLLEAHVVARYADPVWNYAPDYHIRSGWWLRSNALSTLLMLGLNTVFPIAVAGKLVLSGYFVLLIGGLAALLHEYRRPAVLLLAAPPLLYNLTFTAGMINWSYGLALIPWALLVYERWRYTSRTRWLIFLAVLLLLIYTAHVLAWGLCVVVLCVLATADHMPRRAYGVLVVVLSSAAPLLLMTRPLLALVPALAAMACLVVSACIRRWQLRPATVALVGALGALLYLAAWRALKPWLAARLPDVGYSLYDKLVAPLRLFALPQHSLPVAWELVAANLVIAVLLGAALLVLIVALVRRGARVETRWQATVGALALVYLIVPTRTSDIIVTEPRVLLVACIVMLTSVCVQRAPRIAHGLSSALVALALVVSSAAQWYTLRYDTIARGWAQTLSHIPPRERVLVLSRPLNLPTTGLYRLVRQAQVFDGNQFSSTYALEHGGFVSNTFFNGPLLPADTLPIPPYWWSDFNPPRYVAAHCGELHTAYRYVVTWNTDDVALLDALSQCYTTRVVEGPLRVWERTTNTHQLSYLPLPNHYNQIAATTAAFACGVSCPPRSSQVEMRESCCLFCASFQAYLNAKGVW